MLPFLWRTVEAAEGPEAGHGRPQLLCVSAQHVVDSFDESPVHRHDEWLHPTKLLEAAYDKQDLLGAGLRRGRARGVEKVVPQGFSCRSPGLPLEGARESGEGRGIPLARFFLETMDRRQLVGGCVFVVRGPLEPAYSVREGDRIGLLDAQPLTYIAASGIAPSGLPRSPCLLSVWGAGVGPRWGVEVVERGASRLREGLTGVRV